jgi:thiol:disulfide interchange protein DsbD
MTRHLRSVFLALCALAMAGVVRDARAIDEKDLLPVDQAFALSVDAPARDRIELTWKIAPGYYLYRQRISVQGIDGGALAMPKGHAKHDEFFGDVEIYRDALIATYTGTTAPDAREVELKVKYQGCADAGICYPPQMRTVKVALPAPRATRCSARVRRRPCLFGNTGRGAQVDAAPLPPEQAFKVEAIADGGNALLLRFTPAPGYYLYRDKTSLKLDAGEGSRSARRSWPPGKLHRDEHFGDVVVYFDQVEVPVPVQRAHAKAADGTLRRVVPGLPGRRHLLSGDDAVAGGVAAGGQCIGCECAHANDRQPRRRPAPRAQPRRHAARVDVAAVLRLRPRLAFTPCVLPMVPILSGLIAGRGERVGRGARVVVVAGVRARERGGVHHRRRARGPARRGANLQACDAERRGCSRVRSRRCSWCCRCRCSACTNCNCPRPALRAWAR